MVQFFNRRRRSVIVWVISTHHNNFKPQQPTYEFEYCYQNITNDVSHLSEDAVFKLKAKLRHTCEKYSDTKTSILDKF